MKKKTKVGRAIKLDEVIDGDRIDTAVQKVKKELSPIELAYIKAYMIHNGCPTAISKALNISRRKVYFMLADRRLQKKIKKAFNRLGISIGLIGGTIRDVMTRKGSDWRTDFNRLKAAELAVKILGIAAPKKIEKKIVKENINKFEMKGIVVQLIKMFKSYEDEGKEKPNSAIDLSDPAESRSIRHLG